MPNADFEWAAAKATTNLKKHAVSFDEGATIFHDPLIASIPDPDHSENEERYLSIGMSAQGRLLVVVHTERGERTRLISCRKATPSERKTYENT
jgi:uncharacterized DUF497 family protein